jgi:asparagine synthase (glutamine-hydrolysing)
LLDQKLVELAAAMPGSLKMPGGRLKHPLKRAMSGLLPDAILNREKRGFGAPVGAWFRHELAGLVSRLLSPACIERRGLLHAPAVAQLLREHAAQRADRSDHILALCNLEIWCRLYLDGESIDNLSGELAQGLAA